MLSTHNYKRYAGSGNAGNSTNSNSNNSVSTTGNSTSASVDTAESAPALVSLTTPVCVDSRTTHFARSSTPTPDKLRGKIKLVASDLDGTLLTDASCISPRTAQTICRLAKNGIDFTIATGRILSRLPLNLCRETDLHYAVLANGAETWDLKRNICLSTLPLSGATVTAVLRVLAAFPLYFEVYFAGEAYTDNARRQFYRDSLYSPAKLIDMRRSRHTVPDLFEFVAARKISKVVMPQATPELLAELDRKCAPIKDLIITNSAFGNREYNAGNCTKVAGIKALVEYLHLQLDEVLVFGDAGNDLPMFATFPHSVAMANATPNIAAKAAYRTGNNNADGVAEFCEAYLL